MIKEDQEYPIWLFNHLQDDQSGFYQKLPVWSLNSRMTEPQELEMKAVMRSMRKRKMTYQNQLVLMKKADVEVQ